MVDRVDRRVVGDAIHHHLADDRADPVRLGSPERGVEAGLVHGAVHQGGRGPGGGEGAPGCGRDALGGLDVEPALQREDVALEPRQQVHPGAEPRVRELRQMGVEVDHARQQHPRPQVDRARSRVGPIRRRPGVDDPPACIDLHERIGFVTHATVPERCQQTTAQDEWGRGRQFHARQATGHERPGSSDPGQ